MLHAAGRKVYQRGPEDFVALRPDEAAKRGLAGKEIDAFRFVPMRATVDDGKAGLSVSCSPAEPNGFVFRWTDPRYKWIMASCLKNLLASWAVRDTWRT